MRRFKIAVFVLLGSLSVYSLSWPKDASPILYSAKAIPRDVRKLLSGDGFTDIDKRMALVWIADDVKHYLIPLQDNGGGCSIVDVNERSMSYKILDSYGQCQIAGVPKVKDLIGNGSSGIVITLKLHANGMESGIVKQKNAYLYVPSEAEFCRNDDAGSFANGTRVPNSVIRFGSSNCR